MIRIITLFSTFFLSGCLLGWEGYEQSDTDTDTDWEAEEN